MRGTAILIIFFLIFTVASLLIPSPMFPGNVFCLLIKLPLNSYHNFLSAVFNGIFYGAILWVIFILISRRLFVEK